MKKYLKVLPAVYHFHVLVSCESIDTENFNQRYYLMSQEFVSDVIITCSLHFLGCQVN